MSRDAQASYYDAGGIETLDIIKAKLTREQFQGYLLGNALKYQCRVMHKNPDDILRDAEKAANYARWFQDELDKDKADEKPVNNQLKIDVEKLEQVLLRLADEANKSYTGLSVTCGIANGVTYRLTAVGEDTVTNRDWWQAQE